MKRKSFELCLLKKPLGSIPEEFGTVEQWKEKYTKEQLIKEFTSDEYGVHQIPLDECFDFVQDLVANDYLYHIKLEADYLEKLTYDGALRIFGEPLSSEVMGRLIYELHVIKLTGFPIMYLIMHDIARFAHEELDAMIGPGIGRLAGSLVAYCLGITNIDPLKYDLLFENYICPQILNSPDLNLITDIDGKREIFRWLEEVYGENGAYMMRPPQRLFGDSVAKLSYNQKMPLDKLIYEDQYCWDCARFAKAMDVMICGTPENDWEFVISSSPIRNQMPVFTIKCGYHQPVKHCIKYNFDVYRSDKMVDVGVIGFKALAELKKACAYIEHTQGVSMDLNEIPKDDQKTMEVFKAGETVGVFGFDDKNMQKYLKQLKPSAFEDILQLYTLYYSFRKNEIPTYIKRYNGDMQITYPIPVMEIYLKETYGMMVYEEQLLLLSRLLGDLNRKESFELRKAVSKAFQDKIDEFWPMFFDNGVKNGHDPKVLKRIWSEWSRKGWHYRSKSNEVCYVRIAYLTAYLKAHYPAEYMAAIINCRFDQPSEVVRLTKECQRMGIDLVDAYAIHYTN